MFERFRAVIGVLWTGGRVALREELSCPYCDTHHDDYSSMHTDCRPLVSSYGNLLCRQCGERLDTEECDACGVAFGEEAEQEDDR